MTEVVLVLTTVSDNGRAESIAAALVEARLAACVNIHGPMVSVYRWKGAVERDSERQLVVKTIRRHVAAVEARIRALHDYELPELLIVPVESGSEAYLSWVLDNTKDTKGKNDTKGEENTTGEEDTTGKEDSKGARRI
jgi:periplasmic divalent cation tolerance protein